MANRYWVGGTGTWSTASTTNWSATSGGASGASVPTAADSVFFDQASTYTVTMTGPLTCLDFTVSAGTVTFVTGSGQSLAISGSLSSIFATNWTMTGATTFNATTTGKTISINGRTFGTGNVTFDGIGGGWALGSDFYTATTATTTLTNGALNINGFILYTSIFNSSNANTRSIAFGSAGINIGINTTIAGQQALGMANATNFTCTGTGGFFADVSVTRIYTFGTTGGSSTNAPNLKIYTSSGAAAQTLTAGSWFNVLDFTTSTFTIATSSVNLNGLVLSQFATFTALTVTMVSTGTITTNSNNTLGSLIINNGAGTTTLTSVLNCGTFTMTAGTINFASFNLNCTGAASYTAGTLNNIGTISCTTWTHNAGATYTLTAGTISASTSFTVTSGTFTYSGGTITTPSFVHTAGAVTTTVPWTMTTNSTYTLTAGTLTLGGTLTTGIFSSSNANTRAIAFGTNNIVLAHTTAGTSNLSMANATNFTYTGTGGFTADASITRTFTFGTTGGSTTNAPNLTLTGSGTAVATITTGSWFNKLDFGITSFAMATTVLNLNALALSTGGTFNNLGVNAIGTGTITPNGKTIAAFVVNNGAATVTLAGALSVFTYTQTAGTIDFASFNLTCSGAAAYTAGTLSNIGTISCTTWTVTGAFTLNQGTITPSVSFVLTSGSFTYSSGGTLSAVPAFTHTAGTVSLNKSYALTATGTYTFTAGAIIIADSVNLTTGIFASATSNARSIAFGSSIFPYGNIILAHTTAATTVLSFANATLFTVSGPGGFTADASITRTYVFGTTNGLTTNCPNLTLTGSGTAVQTITYGSGFNKLDFGTTAFTVPTATAWVNSVTLSTGGTFTNLSILMFGTGTITNNGKAIAAFTVNTPGTATLSAPLSCTSYTQTSGTIDFASFNLSCSSGVSYTAGTLLNVATITCTTWTVAGAFTFGQGTITPSTSFAITSGSFTYNVGATLSPVPSFIQTAGNVTLNQAYALTATGTYTLTAGTLTLGANLTTGIFSSSGTGIRSIVFGSNNIVLAHTTAGTTVLAASTTTNYTQTDTGGGFGSDASITRTYTFGVSGSAAGQVPNLVLTGSGTAVQTITSGSNFNLLDFGTTAFTLPTTLLYVNNLNLSTGGTFTNLSVTTANTTGGTITTNNKPIAAFQNGFSTLQYGVSTLVGNLTCTTFVNNTLSTINFGGYNVSCSSTFTHAGTDITNLGTITCTTFTINGPTFTMTSGTITPSTSFTVTSGAFTYNGGTITTPVFVHTAGTVTLNQPLTLSTSYTLTAGTLTLGANLTTGSFNGSSGGIRSIAFGTNIITCTGTGTVWNTSTAANLTITGTPLVNVTNATATATTVLTGALSESNSISFNFSAGTYALTFLGTAGYTVKDVDFTGFAGTLNATAACTVYGNYTLSSGMTVTTSANTLTFGATSGTKTITTSNKTLPPVSINGLGGTFNLSGNLTSTGTVQVLAGTFDTTASNYAITALGFDSSTNTNIRSVNFNASTISLTGTAGLTLDSTNLTFSAGTSQLTLSNATSTVLSALGGAAFYNVSVTGGAPVVTITGTNSYNSLAFTNGATSPSVVTITNNQTVAGALSSSSTNAGTRLQLQSSIAPTQVTLSASSVSLTDVDFAGINAAGAAIPFTGTRLGNLGNNSNITFTAGTNKYWSLATGGNWNSVAWATTSGGTPNVNNYPLPQDTCIIQNTGLNTSVTITMNVNATFTTIDMSTRTNAMTLSIPSGVVINVLGDWITGSGVGSIGSVTSTGGIYFSNNTGGTSNITSAGKIWSPPIYVNGNVTVKLVDALVQNAASFTSPLYLLQGSINLNGFDWTTTSFTSNLNNTRSVIFGSNFINLASLTSVYNLTITNSSTFTATGSGGFKANMSIIRFFNVSVGSSSPPNLFINAGSSNPSFVDGSTFNTLDFTGSTGTPQVGATAGTLNVYSLVLATGGTYTNMTINTIGTGTITGSGKTLVALNCLSGTTTLSGTLTAPTTVNGATLTHPTGAVLNAEPFILTTGTVNLNGGTLPTTVTFTHTAGAVNINSVIVLSSSSAYTFTSGTITLAANLTVGSFASSNTNTRSINFGTNNIFIVTTSGVITALDLSNANGFDYTGTGGFSSSMNNVRTFTSAITSAVSGSVLFNGTNQYLSIPANPAFNFITSGLSFTVECWIYPISFGANYGTFMSVGITGGIGATEYLWSLAGGNGGGVTFTMFSSSGANTSYSAPAGTLTFNAWNHVAVTKNSSNTINIWVNGVSVATGTSNQTNTNTGRLGYIATGTGGAGQQYQNCYISNVRWVKGVAVYTGTFTPSTSPLTATQTASTNISAITGTQTSLLLNTPNNSSFLADVSSYNNTVTNNNGATSNALTPITVLPAAGNPPNLFITGGASIPSITTGSYFHNLDFTGSTSGLPSTIINLNGDLTLASGGTYTNLSVVLNNSSTVTPNGKTLSTVTLQGNQIIAGTLVCTSLVINGTTFDFTSGTINPNSVTITGGGILNYGGTAILGSFTNLLHTLGTFNVNKAFALNSNGAYNFTAGYINLTANLTVGAFISSNTNNRVINFDTNNIILAHPTATTVVLSMATATGFSWTSSTNTPGSGTGCFQSTMSVTRTFTFGTTGGTATNAPNLYLDSGSSIATITTGSWFNELNYGTTAYTQAATTLNVNSIILSTGGTYTALILNLRNSGTLTYNGKTTAAVTLLDGSPTITDIVACTTFTVNGATFNFSSGTITPSTSFVMTSGSFTYSGTASLSAVPTFTHTAGNVTFSKTYSLTTTGTYTLTAGNLTIGDGSSVNLNTGIFSSDNSNIRSIAFIGNINLQHTTAATTVVAMSTLTGFSYTGTGGFTTDASVTRTINIGATAGGSITNAPNVTLTSGSSVVTLSTNSWFNNLNFGSTTFTNPSGYVYNIAGSLTLAATGTYPSLTINALGTGTITSNGKSLVSLVINTTGTITAYDALSVSGTLTLTQGTLYTTSNISSASFASTGTATRGIIGTNITYTITGSGATAFSNASGTGLTMQGFIINMNSGLAKTFAGGGGTYPVLNQGGAAAITITGANSFDNITNSVQPSGVTFPSATITTVNNFGLSGIAGSLITINSSTAASAAIISKASGIVYGNYLSIKDSTATGGATWYAGPTSVDVSNNTGWVFSALPIVNLGNISISGGVVFSNNPV